MFLFQLLADGALLLLFLLITAPLFPVRFFQNMSFFQRVHFLPGRSGTGGLFFFGRNLFLVLFSGRQTVFFLGL